MKKPFKMNNYAKFFLIVVLAMNCSTTEAQNIKTFAQPESINSDGKFFYVTNIGPNPDPLAYDQDGFVSKVDKTGKIIVKSMTSEKLNAPKGTAVIGSTLYIADLERIIGIDLSTGKKKREISLTSYNTSFANDLGVKDSNTLFVSATDTGEILELDLKTGNAHVIARLKGVNGIFYDQTKKRLYACSFIFEDPEGGEIGMVKWIKGKPVYQRIGNFKGAFDGIGLLNQNTLLVSNWKTLDHSAGAIEKINLDKNTSQELGLPLMYGPADFFIDRRQKRIMIPIVMENRLHIEKY